MEERPRRGWAHYVAARATGVAGLGAAMTRRQIWRSNGWAGAACRRRWSLPDLITRLSVILMVAAVYVATAKYICERITGQ